MHNIYNIVEQTQQAICSVQDTKIYLKINCDDTDEELIINNIIDTAIEIAENLTKLTLVVRKLDFTCINCMDNKLILKYRPIHTLNKILIDDCESVLEKHKIDNNNAIIYLENASVNSTIRIEYLAGFKEDMVPSAIKQAIMMHIATMYEGRTNIIPEWIKELYAQYRIARI